MIALVDYATPSVFESNRDRSVVGMSANARRPVRFHGRVVREICLVRFALRALGEVIWSDDTWVSTEDYRAFTLDPIITVHPDRIFFEAFSFDQSVYAMLALDPDLFVTEGDVRPGTTNVDFTAWLWASLGELRSSRETWLRIDPVGFEVQTRGAGGRYEQKVELPDAWVRGFLQLQGAMAMPGTRLRVRPVDLLAAIRFLRYTKAKISPRALRYEFMPGEDARIVLEPWEHVVPLRGAAHNYTEPRTIRTWGRRRLALIEPLLPSAERVDIFLKGRALPSFYAVKLPGMTFLAGLSGWTEQSWTGSGSFDLLGAGGRLDTELVSAVQKELAVRVTSSDRQMAEALKKPQEAVLNALVRLCRQGRALYDVEARVFRHRELFEEPVDESQLYPPDPRSERAQDFLARDRVKVALCQPQETRKLKKLPSPDGPVTREIIYRDWRVEGSVDEESRVEIVVNDVGRILFGVCGCLFFRENILGKGPCEHLIALLAASDEMRRDLQSSVAASEAELTAAQAQKRAAREARKEEDDEEEGPPQEPQEPQEEEE